jgi:anti-sigma regulatory factor (Ser/Thr protein kinase)
MLPVVIDSKHLVINAVGEQDAELLPLRAPKGVPRMTTPLPEPTEALIHEDRLTYTPSARSVSLARRRSARLVHEWGHPGIAGDVGLVVSEMASNALLHGFVQGRLFRVHLTLTKSALRVEVTDARGECLPVQRIPAGDDQSGRGLALIDAFAARWGVEACVVGKTVWAEFDVG